MPLDLTFQYCTEFLLRGTNIDIEQVKADLNPHGDCLLVVGDERTAKIHLHTNNPGLILDYAIRLGEMSEIQINNMVEQSQQRLERIKQAQGTVERPAAETKEIGLVAVAMGDGLAQIFRSLGVDEVVEGGQTMNPSTEDLLHGVEKVAAKQVLILPNNGNVIMTAGQVSELTELPVAVAPSKSIPQGIAALMTFNPLAPLQENVLNMTRALSEIKTGEVTYAVRASKINGFSIAEGDIIGLADDELAVVGKKPKQVLEELLDKMVAGSRSPDLSLLRTRREPGRCPAYAIQPSPTGSARPISSSTTAVNRSISTSFPWNNWRCFRRVTERFRIVTDSTADLPAKVLKDLAARSRPVERAFR